MKNNTVNTVDEATYTKADAERQITNCMYACQRLYQIRERGLWDDVYAVGQEALQKMSDTDKFTKEQLDEILKPVLSKMYAIAGYDD